NDQNPNLHPLLFSQPLKTLGAHTVTKRYRLPTATAVKITVSRLGCVRESSVTSSKRMRSSMSRRMARLRRKTKSLSFVATRRPFRREPSRSRSFSVEFSGMDATQACQYAASWLGACAAADVIGQTRAATRRQTIILAVGWLIVLSSRL